MRLSDKSLALSRERWCNVATSLTACLGGAAQLRGLP
jgi:hypothetical protein